MSHTLQQESAICATRVFIVEDHTMIRQILARILSAEDDIEVVGTAGTVAEATNLIGATCPDVVLVDILLPDGSGIDLVQNVKSEHSDTKVILLTALQNEESILQAIEAGAEGYMLKSSDFESLLKSIRLVMAGKQIYDPLIASPILQRIIRATPSLAYGQNGASGHALSAREREVVRLVSRGLTDKEIAQALSLSIHTVKTHVCKVLKRLGVSSRRELLSGYHLPLDSQSC